MRPRAISVESLAHQAGMDTESAVLRLMYAGINVTTTSHTVAARESRHARKVLGIRDKPDSMTVEVLAGNTTLSEADVRTLLVAHGILRKRRMKRIPKHRLGTARRVISEASDPPRTSGQAPPATKKRKKNTVRKTIKPSWPTIGREQSVLHLTAKDLEEIHWILVDDFAKAKDPIDPPGVRGKHLLGSAVCRPWTAVGDRRKYPTVTMAGAALLHSVVHNHPFHNGNKRTALVALLVLLDKNGWVLSLPEDDLYNYLLLLAAHELRDKKGRLAKTSDEETLHVSRWLQRNVRQVRKGERPLKFRQLREILNTYGCKMNHPKGVGNRVNIVCGELQTQIGYTGEGGEVDQNAIHKVRRDLALDETHGYDSDIFYNKGPRIPRFIRKYRRVLDRLAKT